MSKIAIIYWSGTGNTQAMAEAILEGAKAAGADASLFQVSEITAAQTADYEKLILGCPSMGAENLEEGEFEPFFSSIENSLSGKKVALFGSYGWGDGQWMRDWTERTQGTGAVLYGEEGFILNETPDDSGLQSCRELGEKIAAW